MGIVGIVAGEIANSRIGDGAIRTLLEAPIRLPFRLERQHADTQQPGVVFNADKLGGIGRCQPLVGEGKTEPQQKGRDQEQPDQHHGRSSHEPARETVPGQFPL
ncbi:hypothetical protein D3C86_1729800 [compost metagenome]